MNRLGYQILGFAVWNTVKLYFRARYDRSHRRVAASGLVALVVAVLAALLLGARRATNG